MLKYHKWVRRAIKKREKNSKTLGTIMKEDKSSDEPSWEFPKKTAVGKTNHQVLEREINENYLPFCFPLSWFEVEVRWVLGVHNKYYY